MNTISFARPNEGESVIDYQNRQIASKNKAIEIQESYTDISDENFNADEEAIVI